MPGVGKRTGGKSSRAATEGNLTMSVKSSDLKTMAKLMGKEADRKTIRKDFAADAKAVLAPLTSEARTAAGAIPSRGTTVGRPLRPAIARAVGPRVKLTSRVTVIGIKVGRTPGVRQFALAGRRMNRKSFKHLVFGRENSWTVQVGDPGWFDRIMTAGIPNINAKMADVIDRLAARLTKG
jgi:hypothetical protein